MSPISLRRNDRWIRICLLTALLLFTTSLLPFSGWLQDQAVDAISISSDQHEQVLFDLYTVKDDLSVIARLLADQQLGLFAESSDDTDELTSQQMKVLIGFAAQYRQEVEQVLLEAGAREEPDLQPLKQCRTAKLAMLRLTAGMLAEYEQVLQYSVNLMTVGNDLLTLSDLDETDMADFYLTYSDALTRSAELLRSESAPSFLEIMNDRLVDALLQMDDAVYYTYVASELNDPIRLNASDYRLSIVLRRFDQILSEVDHDVANRHEKLSEDAAEIERVYTGLSQWAQANIDLFEPT